MYNLDTDEEVDMDMFLNALQDGEIILDNRELTEEEWKQLRKDIVEFKARTKVKAKEPVLA